MFANARWEITELERGAQAMYAQIPMSYSTQSVCVAKCPLKEFTTEILHRPNDLAGKPSEIGKELGAVFALNGGYFNVGRMIPSVYFRTGKHQVGHTHPTELYRVDVDIVVPLLEGDKPIDVVNDYSPALFYDKRHPRTIFGTDNDGNAYLVVIDGRFKGKADGATIYEAAYICSMLGMTEAINLDGGGSTTLWTEKTGVINHPYDNRKFDHDGERTIPNLILVY